MYHGNFFYLVPFHQLISAHTISSHNCHQNVSPPSGASPWNGIFGRVEGQNTAEIPPEVWKTKEFDDILLRYCNAVCNQNTIDRWIKRCTLHFPRKGDLGIAKNYQGITLTPIAGKIYNALLRNRIEARIEKILRKNQNGFRRNRSTTSKTLTIRRILGVSAKNLEATILFVDFSKSFDSIHRGKIEQILLAYDLPKETVAAVMILYKNTKVKICSPVERQTTVV